MTKCEFCGKIFNTFEPKGFEIAFCDKDCLSQYCDEYVKDHWRDYLQMMGVNYRE